jgi:hypothetical protein
MMVLICILQLLYDEKVFNLEMEVLKAESPSSSYSYAFKAPRSSHNNFLGNSLNVL